MTGFDSEQRLRRAAELVVKIDSAGVGTIEVAGSRVPAGQNALAILDVFRRPRTLAEALAKLEPTVSGADEWIALTGEIVALRDVGILVGDQEPSLPAPGYGEPRVHIKMLDDRARTSLWIAGVQEVVRPGDVVVDIGTGTGVLAVAAARAGARHVYAIEASTIGRGASAVFHANGVADRVTLVEGWSMSVSLPERADVLVSEMIGHEPLGEEALEITRDARRRLLKPGARLVPSHIRIYAIAATFSDSARSRLEFTGAAMDRWRDAYGIDFSPLRAVRRNPSHELFLDRHRETWVALAAPALVAEVDLTSLDALSVDTSTQVGVTRAGRVDGVVVYFDAQLGPTSVLTTHPDHAEESNHWRRPTWMIPEPFDVTEGERLTIRYRYRAVGGASGATVSRA